MPTLDTPTRQFIERDGGGAGLPHMPGLDGLRGLAVLGVVVFHSGHGVLVGGYLGVSTFFTLSGFLITSLLLGESERTGGVDLRAFWARRFRRLLPASTATLLLVVVLGVTVATAGQRLELRGDVLASLLQVANWRFIVEGTSYGDLFAAPSPVLHFWSLAIEEQFYLLFPPLMYAVMRVTRHRRGAILAVLLALSAVSWSIPLLFDLGVDRIYFGTDTRAAELLLGAVLATLLSHRDVRRRMTLRYHARSAVLAVGAGCLVVQLYWWFTVDQAEEWLYSGGLGLYGLMTCAVIGAVAVPTGPLHAAFSTRALRYLGLRSYAIYLAHWPIFLALRQGLPELDAPPRTALAVAATLLVAELSHRALEQPVRTGRWPARGRGGRVALPAVVVVGLVAMIPLPVDQEEVPIDFDAAFEEFEARRVEPDPPPTVVDEDEDPGDDRVDDGVTPTTAATTTTVVEQAPVPRIATFGDSTALLMALGLDRHLQDVGLPGGVFGSVELGCGVSRFDAIRHRQIAPVPDICREWPRRWSASLQGERPHIAQLVTGVWEVADARLPGTSEFASVGSPEVDAFVESELLAAVDTLASTGALVLLVLWPPDVAELDGAETVVRLRTPPERMQRFHELQLRVAAARPDTTRIVDLAGWFGDRSQDPQWRPDGVHLQEDRAAQVYREWMAGEIDRHWQSWWAERRGAGG